MDRPFTSYMGQEPYVFVCYAHEDSAVVYPEIAWIKEQGHNLWYDEGISVGANWRRAIGDSLLGASHVLFYISPRSLASEHCNREIGLALDENKVIVPVYLEPVELTSDLKIGLNRVQALQREQTTSYQYRLLQALGQVVATPEPVFRLKHPNRRRSVSRLLVAATILVLIAGFGQWYWSRSQTVDSENVLPQLQSTLPSIAVLPFVNMSSDATQNFFSDGISEEILNQLAKNPALKVISRSSAFSFRGTNTDLPLIAEKLGVDHILEGSVRRSGNMVRVSVQLIDAINDGFLWSETYDRNLDDILAVQSEIARRVARALNVALNDNAAADRAVNAESYLLYSQGRHLLGLGTTADASRAKDLLLQAVELDPTFVRAWTELARAYGQLRGVEWDAGDKITSALDRALALDPDDSVANAWRGWNVIFQQQDFEAGIAFYSKSLAADPANVDILRGLVNVLTLIDRPQQALSVAKYVVDRDPLCIICINNLAEAYRDRDQLGESSLQYQRSLALSPHQLDAISSLAINQLLQGDVNGALEWNNQLPEGSIIEFALRAMAMHEQGHLEERDSILTSMREKWPDQFSIAEVDAWIGELDTAFAALEHLIAEQPSYLPALRSPLLRNLHTDPRWIELLEKSGLSPERLAKLELTLNLPE